MPFDHAYAALINAQNMVEQVIVIPHLEDDDGKITEYCNSIGLAGRWIDTSFLGSRRGRFAGLGDIYDEALDIFVTPHFDEPEPETD